MEALGRLVRNAAGAFVRHTPRRDCPPPSDWGSGSDGDPSSPDDSSGDDDDSARGDDPPNGTFGRRPLRISLYNPLFHSGSDGRPIKGALRNPGGVKVEEPASPNATSTREPSRGGAAVPPPTCSAARGSDRVIGAAAVPKSGEAAPLPTARDRAGALTPARREDWHSTATTKGCTRGATSRTISVRA